METKKVTKNEEILSFVRSQDSTPTYTLLPAISHTPTRLQPITASPAPSLTQEKSLPDAINLLLEVEKQKNIGSNSRDVSYNLDDSRERCCPENEIYKNELF